MSKSVIHNQIPFPGIENPRQKSASVLRTLKACVNGASAGRLFCAGRDFQSLKHAFGRYKNSLRPAFLSGVLFVVLPLWVSAQPPADNSVLSAYVPPPKGAKVFRVDRIEGQLTYRPVSAKWYQTVLGGHLTLFDDHQAQVATAVSGEEGRFEFKDIAAGNYTLVMENNSVHPLTVPVQIAARPESKTEGSKIVGPGLMLVMRDKTDRRKSVAIPITNRTLRAELLARVEKDQSIRREMVQQGVEHPNKDIQARMTAIDAENLAWMKGIVQQYGWPEPDLIGIDGTEAAFLMVQHAPYEFQKQLLPSIRAAYRAGRLSGQSYALLQDRILVREGKPQIYGTQSKPFAEWHNGEPALSPIVDEAHVDQRRAAIGLPSLVEYIKLLKDMYLPQAKDTQK